MTSMNINSALSSALSGLQQAQSGIAKNAFEIASVAKPNSNVNLTESIVNLKINERSFEANAKVLSTVDDTIGTLLDVIA